MLSASRIEDIRSRVAEEVEDAYRLHYNLLKYLACQKFRIPPGDAENLIQEVFLSYLSSASQVRDIRSWLVGAVCNGSRNYWRSHGRTEALPSDLSSRRDPASIEIADSVALQITVRETLSRLHQKCQDTLRLRYYDGCSAAEVARHLDTTNRYAEKLIAKCLKRAHDIYVGLTGGKGTS